MFKQASVEDPITVRDVYNIVSSYNSENTNPMDLDRQCLYTDEFGNHCIAGQLLVDIGLKAPDSEYIAPFDEMLMADKYSYREYFTADAIDTIVLLQKYADEFSLADNDEPWGNAFGRVFRDSDSIYQIAEKED